MGKVEYMNLRMTKLRTPDGELVSIANGSFEQVKNTTNRWSRVNIGVDVAYKTDLDKAIAVIEAAGGIVTNWSGGPAYQGGRVLAAAGQEQHQAALEILKDFV